MDQTARPASPLPPPKNVTNDANLALYLVTTGQPTGVEADALRERLRSHIRAMVGPAETYAARLADSRAKDIAGNTVEHARAVAADPGTDPVASLRLLSKSCEILARYTANVQPRPHP